MDKIIKLLTNCEKSNSRIERIIPKEYSNEMKVESQFFLSDKLLHSLLEKENNSKEKEEKLNIGFSTIEQSINVASLPGIYLKTIGLPDIHLGYGFSIGQVAAFDLENPELVISPGGVGYDINCGVRLIRTNLKTEKVKEKLYELCSKLQKMIPVGYGVKSNFKINLKEIKEILVEGQDWCIRKGYAWENDRGYCEDLGRLLDSNVELGQKALSRGQQQLGTLGCGNHYLEIQKVSKIFDQEIGNRLGISEDQVLIMIHTGSRGLGHLVASEYIKKATEIGNYKIPSLKYYSKEGQDFFRSMKAAANYAYCNRSMITYYVREAFSEIFNTSAKNLEMSLLYDVSHNIAKEEIHNFNGKDKNLLIHRKGATRAFPPHHPDLPESYKSCGQPVLVGGSMGTCSYLLVGGKDSMVKTFGSACHGAGRILSRKEASKIPVESTFNQMKQKGILLFSNTPDKISEESPFAYKDIEEVISVCEIANIAIRVAKLEPLAVIKG